MRKIKLWFLERKLGKLIDKQDKSRNKADLLSDVLEEYMANKFVKDCAPTDLARQWAYAVFRVCELEQEITAIEDDIVDLEESVVDKVGRPETVDAARVLWDELGD